MDKERTFETLKKQTKAILLEVLESAYDELSASQRRWIFGEFDKKEPAPFDGEELLEEIEEFERDSLNGLYYAPFNVNSKNFMNIPEETEEWCDRMGDLLKESARATEQGAHGQAAECFSILYKLIEAMERGEEIVFAEEMGIWMIPVEEKEILASYITSLAAMKSPQEFSEAVLPLVRRDSYHSFAARVYTSANRIGSKEQKAHLRAELKRQNIPTGPRSNRR